MDEEIILDRGAPSIMKLNADEEALMDEITLQPPSRPPRVPRPPSSRPPPPRPAVEEDDALNDFINPTKRAAPPPRPQYAEEDEDDEDDFSDDYDDEPTGGGYAPPSEQPSTGYKTIDEERADLLNKLQRLEKKGFSVNKRLNAYSPIEDIRNEVKRITYSIEVDQGVKFARRMLVACTTGLEFLNKRYNPFELQLEGWSESVHESIDDYDGVFEELIVKYRNSMHVAPEVKLIMMLGGSAMMFHLTNSMFKAAIPNMNDVIKQNPDLVKNMMSAVQNTAVQNAASAPGGGGGYEMQGPGMGGMDLSSLMGSIMMPPAPPMNTTPQERPPPEDSGDDISDIVESEADAEEEEVKEINVKPAPKKRGRKKKGVEINL
jgi:hypothetical protein